MLKNLYLFIAVFILIISCKQNEIVPKYSKFKTDDSQLNFRILYPKNFDKNKSYPLTLFLHGIGERGDDNELQLKYVDKVFLNQNNYDNFQSIVIFPQAPLDDNWSSRVLTNNEIRQVFQENEKPTKSLQLVIKLMDSLVKEDFIDNKRVYLSGLSNGAMGSFELLKNRPNMFASAVLICGGGNPRWAKDFAKTTPVWVAHGSDDDVVFPELSINMVKSIIKHGGSPKFTLYENVNHESWFNVFNDPNYLEWMFSFTKN
jgi:predicted peptidase